MTANYAGVQRAAGLLVLARVRAVEALEADAGSRAGFVELAGDIVAQVAQRSQLQLERVDLFQCYLLNFGEALLRDGIVRAVNGLPEAPEPQS